MIADSNTKEVSNMAQPMSDMVEPISVMKRRIPQMQE